MEERVGKARLACLLAPFGAIKDPREPAKVRYPLSGVLFLVVAATIAGCDDDDEIADGGEAQLDFLRGFSEYYVGTPGEDGLRVLMNRIDPALFQECFTAWGTEMWPQAATLMAIDDKTSRRSHDRGRRPKPLHLVSACATTQRLGLAQEAVEEKETECGALPAILDRLDIDDALVTIDAIACHPKMAAAVTDRKGHSLLAVTANQPTLHREIALSLADPPPGQTASFTEVDKGQGGIETHRDTVSHSIDWLLRDRRYPGEPRFATQGDRHVREAGSITRAVELLTRWRRGDPELARDLATVAVYEAVTGALPAAVRTRPAEPVAW